MALFSGSGLLGVRGENTPETCRHGSNGALRPNNVRKTPSFYRSIRICSREGPDPKAKSLDIAENIRICRRPAEVSHNFLSAHLLVEHWASRPRALFRNNLVPLAY